MRRFIWALPLVLGLVLPFRAEAFCGFYVAKADTKLYNQASKVVLTRSEDKTVLTMANDYEGPLSEFAVVIPVPTFIERGQIHVTDNAIIDHLDAYTSPRLVEYYDDDPCRQIYLRERTGVMRSAEEVPAAASADSLGVRIEAQYTVGEYDILILSAEESAGLVTWLKQEGYRIPDGAGPVVGSYLKQGMRFFVAKVNLEEQAKTGYTYLRPLQVAYESSKFMLPIRLGTVNAKGPQELFIFMLSRKGRMETTNYRTVKLPTDAEIPLFVKDEFSDFYRAMFDEQVERQGMKSVFLEYAWDMSWCDPCAADPLSRKELRELGAFWIEPDENPLTPMKPSIGRPGIAPSPQPVDAFVTRLHVRYDREHFPEDLFFQETADRENFQGRYVLRHPWTGKATCDAAKEYGKLLPKRRAEQAATLANLTGWSIETIREKMERQSGEPVPEPEPKPKESWWERIWGD